VASVRARKDTGFLFIDFYYRGKRCREQTALPDTPANRKKVQKLLDRIDGEFSLGTFDYARYFPSSRNVGRFDETPMASAVKALGAAISSDGMTSAPVTQRNVNTPLFKDFAETWFNEKAIEWRRSHRTNVRAGLDKILIPRFGEMAVGQITKAEILAFRAELAKVQARGKQTVLSNPRINKLLNPFRMILNEAADRFDFRTPFQNIKQLRVKKVDVQPFGLDEVQKIIKTVRPDFRNYYTTRFFTGMRTGEVDGLKWKYVDFERRLILVRETIVAGEEEYTKTDFSQREIRMTQLVFDALKEQEKATRASSEFVFCTRNGRPLDHKNVTNRVWYPLLRHLGLAKRRPYQTRHTAATLWLASGESPQWIAAQLGHSNTEMLFRVYARFVPNLTRKDGSAFERLLTNVMGNGDRQLNNANAQPADAIPSDKEPSHD
jgi:integrase